jgi:hypothetical protein
MILAAEPERAVTLDELREVQRQDFLDALAAMDRPAAVRLLDLPLHEFFSDAAELTLKARYRGLPAEEERLRDAALCWRKRNRRHAMLEFGRPKQGTLMLHPAELG